LEGLRRRRRRRRRRKRWKRLKKLEGIVLTQSRLQMCSGSVCNAEISSPSTSPQQRI
jgi:hypothetical protein